jgi:hypothetical protein
MNLKLIEEIANAVLYEGYILYPYRSSSVKNQQRWNFGVVAPAGSEDASSMQTECLILGEAFIPIAVRVRFLQLVERSEVNRPALQPWQEAVGRDIQLTTQLGSGLLRHPFHFAATEDITESIVRKAEAIDGAIEIETNRREQDVFSLRVRVSNLGVSGSTRESTLPRSLVSTHTILSVTGGGFVSLIDPPDKLRDMVESCENVGTWPVLVGEEGARDAMLSSPIILYDYPQIAPESPGALFDGTEIDEILTLRIMAMTDGEKSEMRHIDERARQILERTESLPPEHLMKLHGALRGLRPIGEEAK